MWTVSYDLLGSIGTLLDTIRMNTENLLRHSVEFHSAGSTVFVIVGGRKWPAAPGKLLKSNIPPIQDFWSKQNPENMHRKGGRHFIQSWLQKCTHPPAEVEGR